MHQILPKAKQLKLRLKQQPLKQRHVKERNGKNSSVQQSAIHYMAPVFAPVTENATIQHILKVSQQASQEVPHDWKKFLCNEENNCSFL